MTQLEQKTHFIFQKLNLSNVTRSEKSPVIHLPANKTTPFTAPASIAAVQVCCHLRHLRRSDWSATKAAPMLVVWQVRTHLVTCFVCCRCATCRRLIRAGDTDVCRDPRPNHESVRALLAGERPAREILAGGGTHQGGRAE